MSKAIENRPAVIIAHTIPGRRGLMENDFHFHAISLTRRRYPPAANELGGSA